jgi:protein-tyrosine phosphatase
VIALDGGHVSRLGQLARVAEDPADAAASISLLRSYDPVTAVTGELDVGDPYYGGEGQFDTALAQIEAACTGLAAQLVRRLDSGRT